MERRDEEIINITGARTSCIKMDADNIFSKVKDVLQNETSPEKYEIAKEMVLDYGAEIMSYIGDIAKQFENKEENNI